MKKRKEKRREEKREIHQRSGLMPGPPVAG
jgi:hypothetical protein